MSRENVELTRLAIDAPPARGEFRVLPPAAFLLRGVGEGVRKIRARDSDPALGLRGATARGGHAADLGSCASSPLSLSTSAWSASVVPGLRLSLSSRTRRSFS